MRALLHGAFSIGLMKYCKDLKRAHPGFLILDSVFVTYKDPDGLEDAAIQNTPLKDKAFAAFAELPDQYQLIILDNVDVPDWLANSRGAYISRVSPRRAEQVFSRHCQPSNNVYAASPPPV